MRFGELVAGVAGLDIARLRIEIFFLGSEHVVFNPPSAISGVAEKSIIAGKIGEIGRVEDDTETGPSTTILDMVDAAHPITMSPSFL